MRFLSQYDLISVIPEGLSKEDMMCGVNRVDSITWTPDMTYCTFYIKVHHREGFLHEKVNLLEEVDGTWMETAYNRLSSVDSQVIVRACGKEGEIAREFVLTAVPWLKTHSASDRESMKGKYWIALYQLVGKWMQELVTRIVRAKQTEVDELSRQYWEKKEELDKWTPNLPSNVL